MPKVCESIEIKASSKACYDVMWDYQSYPEFVPGVSSITLAKKKKNEVDVVFGVNLIKDVIYTVHVKGTPSVSIEWHLLEGSLFKKIEGRWDLEDVKKGHTLATYTLDIEFNLYVPGVVAKTLVGSSLPGMLKAFKNRIEENQKK